ncbi:minor tail protein [Arthrobacter phage DrSierra]|uniref:Minor tail protein n=1 Tax=Arthrobacter phage DrSierra TaxID=2704034 RepID=A0A6G6XKW4_9CAUD|nr:minor tail protein [Arthrobacter phage DrSierra]QIG58495.1 minor tail protein [Arthrobacter phage DrSierra]
MALETFTTTSASLTLTTGEMLELQPGTNQVLTHLEGWFSPAGTRREGTSRLWAHGSFSERGWRDQRVITVGGHIFTETRTDAANMTDTLSAALADGTAGKFIVDDADLGYREATVYITGTPTVNWDGNRDIFFMIDMVAPDPRKYGELVTVGTAAAAPGGGLAYDLFGTGGTVALSGGNLLDNPGPFTDAGWGTSGGYVKSYETPIHGRTAMVFTKSGASYWITYGRRAGSSGSGSNTTLPTNAGEVVPVTPGQTVYASLDLGTDEPNADGRIAIRFFNSSFASISASECPVADMADNAWQTFSHSAVAPANAAYAWIEWGIAMKAGNTVGGERSWASDAYLGTTPPTSSTGTSGVLDFGAAGSPGTVTLENVGTADSAPVFTVSGYAPGFTITEVSTGARLIYTETVLDGQTLTIDAADGSVLLDGYADRSAYLIRREWTRVPGRNRYTYLFESPGNDGASLTLGVKPAWW